MGNIAKADWNAERERESVDKSTQAVARSEKQAKQVKEEKTFEPKYYIRLDALEWQRSVSRSFENSRSILQSF